MRDDEDVASEPPHATGAGATTSAGRCRTSSASIRSQRSPRCVRVAAGGGRTSRAAVERMRPVQSAAWRHDATHPLFDPRETRAVSAGIALTTNSHARAMSIGESVRQRNGMFADQRTMGDFSTTL